MSLLAGCYKAIAVREKVEVLRFSISRPTPARVQEKAPSPFPVMEL
jgi:hypothetical protein